MGGGLALRCGQCDAGMSGPGGVLLGAGQSVRRAHSWEWVWSQIPRLGSGSSFRAPDAGPSASPLAAVLAGLWPELSLGPWEGSALSVPAASSEVVSLLCGLEEGPSEAAVHLP